MIRAALALVTSVMLVASAVAISRARNAPPPETAPPVAAATPVPSAPVSPTVPREEPTPASDGALPLMPAEAEALGGERLLAAAQETASGPWRDLGHEAWPVDAGRPVYVANAVLSDDRRAVDADVTVGFRAQARTDELVLRFLPGSSVLRGNGLDVVTRVGGGAVPHEVDRDGARLLVALDEPLAAGDAVALRVRLGYDLLDRRDIPDDGGPAGFGVLSWNEDMSVLGHWLPLLTTPDDAGVMIPWGDIGAFPAAIWSVLIESDSEVITGGEESDCPRRSTEREACVWARGVGLRDVAAVAYDDPVVSESEAHGVRVRAVAPRGLASANEAAHAVATGSFESFHDRLGPLAWREVEVAAGPLSGSVVGMEFPGLVIVDEDTYGTMDAGFGAAVLAHEMAHQWFHALVGNGSLSSPVVDESLAQYLSYLTWEDMYGPEAATEYARSLMAADYVAAEQSGLADEPPAQPLAEFEGPAAYGALVYGRGALAWIAAEEAAGRETVEEFLRAVVERYGLAFVSDDELVGFAEERAPDIGAVLRRYWLDPEPITDLPFPTPGQRS